MKECREPPIAPDSRQRDRQVPRRPEGNSGKRPEVGIHSIRPLFPLFAVISSQVTSTGTCRAEDSGDLVGLADRQRTGSTWAMSLVERRLSRRTTEPPATPRGSSPQVRRLMDPPQSASAGREPRRAEDWVLQQIAALVPCLEHVGDGLLVLDPRLRVVTRANVIPRRPAQAAPSAHRHRHNLSRSRPSDPHNMHRSSR